MIKDMGNAGVVTLRSFRWTALVLVGLTLLPALSAAAQDQVEFLSGAKLQGKVLAIRKSDKQFDFQLTLGGRSAKRTFAFSKVHAVTMNGKRFVVTPRTASAADTGGGKTGKTPATSRARVVSKSEIQRMIRDIGSSEPDWYDSTPLKYPTTLDLSWPIKPPKGWNNQKNVGQYIWDIVNPNPSRWRPGIRLVHHCLSLHKSESELANRDMRTLGRMYFTLLQDYPRAAFWLQKAGIKKTENASAMLAECYWRMGNRSMALDQLNSRTYSLGMIKLLGDMGQTDDAMKIVKAYTGHNKQHDAELYGADALRRAGRYSDAIRYYEKVVSGTNYRNKDYEKRHKARARESIEAIKLFEQADVTKVSDGTYRGDSTGYNGRLEVAVEVRSGRIESLRVTDHREKQFYSALDDTPRQVLEQQSVRNVDATSGATITSQAIVNAAAKALASGK